MSRRILVTALGALLLSMSSANAAVMRHETRNSAPFTINPATITSVWDAAAAVAPTPGYGDSLVSNWAGNLVQNQTQTPSGANSNIFYHFDIKYSISAAQAGLWHFRIGGDFGGGGIAFVDGVQLDFNNFDHWWGNDLNNTGSLLVGSVNLAAGNHDIQVYGSEGCCDGHSGVFFKIGGDPNDSNGFTAFTSTGLANPIVVVPEPATAALGLMGLAGLTLRRRRNA